MLRLRVKGRPYEDRRLPLGVHLRELRKRLSVAAIAIVVGAVAGFVLADPIFRLIADPIAQAGDRSDRMSGLNFTAVTQAFDLKLQIALTLGIIISCPVWLYQLWAFLVPGLVRRERRYAVGFIASAVPLFVAGCAAGLLVLPHIVEVMLAFATGGSASLLDARVYYEFVLKLLIATGVAFVLPVFLVLLNIVGVLSASSILRGWRIAVFLIAVFTALATPAADVLSMFLLAIPMVGLYFGAAGVALLHDRRHAKALATRMPAGPLMESAS